MRWRTLPFLTVASVLSFLACSSSSNSGDGTTQPDSSELTSLRALNLKLVNDLRAKDGVPPLVLDEGLNTFATDGSAELSTDHVPHAHFSASASSCSCKAQGENQGDPSGWPKADASTQVTQIINFMYAEGPGGGHHDNIVSTHFTRLGVGIVFVDGERNLYFTNDFGP